MDAFRRNDIVSAATNALDGALASVTGGNPWGGDEVGTKTEL